MRKRILLLSAVVLTGANPTIMAGTVAGNGGSTEVTQMANNTQLVLSYIEQGNQSVTQMNQYATMLRNLQRLNPSALAGAAAQKLWKDQGMNDSFRNLYRIVVGGQQMSYSLRNMDQQFSAIHPGYGNYNNGFDFQNAYRNWSDTTRGAVMGTLRMAAVQADDLQTEGDLIQTLADDSATADGQLQAVQAGNQIGVAMVGQMQKLRQLQMAQIQAQNTTALAEQGKREGNDDVYRRLMEGNGAKSYLQQLIDKGKKK